MRLLGDGPLYLNQNPISDKELFVNPLWHPGPTDDEFHRCALHGINLMVGGALFVDTAKFCTLLRSRVGKAKATVFNRFVLRGLDLARL